MIKSEDRTVKMRNGKITQLVLIAAIVVSSVWIFSAGYHIGCATEFSSLWQNHEWNGVDGIKLTSGTRKLDMERCSNCM